MDIDLFLKLEPLISNGMSVFQMDKFVINDNITPYRKLRQALVEAKARLESLANMDLDIEETILNKEKLNIDSVNLEEIDKKIKNVQLRRLELEINRKLVHREQVKREAEFFLKVISTEIENMGGEEQVLIMLSDPNFHNRQEEDYWIKRLARSVFSDFINYGTISKGVTESLDCLTDDQRKSVITYASSQQAELIKLIHSSKDTILVERD